MQTNLLVEGFFTDLRDVFALRQLEGLDAQGNAVLERYNDSGSLRDSGYMYGPALPRCLTCSVSLSI